MQVISEIFFTFFFVSIRSFAVCCALLLCKYTNVCNILQVFVILFFIFFYLFSITFTLEYSFLFKFSCHDK